MGISNNIEKRKHSRVEFATKILIQVEADGKKIDFKGGSCDLSLKGLFINTDNRPVLGTKCSIKIYLTGTIEKIELLIKGSIARSDDNGIGIEFDSMDVDTYSHLKNIVKYNK